MSIQYKIRLTAKNKKEADKRFKERTKRFISDVKINKVTKESQVIHIYTYDLTLTKRG